MSITTFKITARTYSLLRAMSLLPGVILLIGGLLRSTAAADTGFNANGLVGSYYAGGSRGGASFIVRSLARSVTRLKPRISAARC